MQNNTSVKENKKTIPIASGLTLPEPKATTLRKSVYICLWAIVAVLLLVLVTAVFDRVKPPQQNETDSSTTGEIQGDNSWFNNQPNSIDEIRKGGASKQQIASKKSEQGDNELTDNVETVQTQALSDANDAVELKVAMESPIKAPISDSSVIVNSSNSSNTDRSNNDEITPENDTANFAAHAGLTLTPTQTARLDKLFGDKHLSQDVLQGLNQATDNDYLHASLKKPISPFTLQAGSLIPATLINGINSELPGQLTALVSQNVYDSVNGHYLLIPQGTKLILTYDANISYGQSRILVTVKRLIFPNGDSMDLNGMPAVDMSGYAGLHDEVDNHYSRIYGSGALMGAITAALQLSQPQQSNVLAPPSTSQVMAGAMGQQMGDVALSVMNKNLNIAPTLKIHPGYQFNVQVTADLVFPKAWTNR